jgi:hypothetical protein
VPLRAGEAILEIAPIQASPTDAGGSVEIVFNRRR